MSETDLPVGPPVAAREVPAPPHETRRGRFASLEPLSPKHVPALYKHLGGEHNVWRWTYMLPPGFSSLHDFEAAVEAWTREPGAQFYAVVLGPESSANGSQTSSHGEAAGLMGYFAIMPAHRRIEIGSVILGDAVKGSRAGSEAYRLMLSAAFELGYSRVEWKANALNQKSRRAAERLGFTFEGIFRRHMILKGRARDSAYFSITEDEWYGYVGPAFEAWLDDDNFDADGVQKRKLEQCRRSIREGGK